MDKENYFRRDLNRFFPDIPASDAAVKFLSASAMIQRYNKKGIILPIDAPQHYLYFLVSGAIRSYIVKDPSHELTNNIAIMPGIAFITAYSVEDGDTAFSNTQALEDTELLQVPLLKFTDARNMFPELNAMIVKAMSESFRDYLTMTKVRTLKPFERYTWLHENRPELETRVQKQVLASYLGIDKSLYSRCREKYFSEN